jgi:hypothetical protein
MGQVGIVRQGNRFFREYAIELNDTLVGICVRFGRRDWMAVYNLPENAAFRARFPDPDQIDVVNPVNLMIPLAGAASSGQARRGRLVADYFIVRVTNEIGTPMTLSLRLINGATDSVGVPLEVGTDGYAIIDTPSPGAYTIATSDYHLALAAGGLPASTVDDLTAVLTGSALHPTPDVTLIRNAVTEIVAAPVRYIRCPMCGYDYRIRKTSAGHLSRPCPREAFDLGSIDQAITADETSFSSPVPGQDPLAIPNTVRCRGTVPMAALHGAITIYWDESRFAIANGGDYTLWGGTTVAIIGRTTWGSRPPMSGPGRLYTFHATSLGASPPYASMSVPSNEGTLLSSTLKWMTVHHSDRTQSFDANSVRDIQQTHQDVGIGPPFHREPAADAGYHFVIDAAGHIYEARPLGIKGSHAELFNGGNIGIVISGDYRTGHDALMPASQAALVQLITVLAMRFGDRSVWTHQRRKIQAGVGATECPGDQLIPAVEGIRSVYPGPPP